MTMALIFHELVTNAAKYGALCRADGHVHIAWDWTSDGRTGEPRLSIRWAERNGPAVRPPTRRGFGSRLISQISRSLQGHAEIDFGRDGLSCVIDLPRSHVLPEEHAPYRTVIDRVRQRHPSAS
jgi:two-component sensor histidine kinase